jgi:glutamyl-tRNA synthetase
VNLVGFFFQEELSCEPKLLVGKRMNAAESLEALKRVREVLDQLPAFDEETLETCLRDLAIQLELKAGQLFGIIRVAVTGKKVAPPLFGTMSILGKERVMSRIEMAERALADLVDSEKM